MIEKSATIQNAQGIHCRPSAVIVKEISGYEGKIKISSNNRSCDLTSIIDLITLGLEQGDKINIQVHGPNEEEICLKLIKLFETHFDFPALDV